MASRGLYFVGFRLGATLAILAGLRRGDVRGLIAIAPVVNGGAYVRELRLLQRAIDARRNFVVAPRDELLRARKRGLSPDNGGQPQTSLKAIDLTRLIQAPCPRLLILDRAEMLLDLAFRARRCARAAARSSAVRCAATPR